MTISRSLPILLVIICVGIAGCMGGGPAEATDTPADVTPTPPSPATSTAAPDSAPAGTTELHFINVGQSVTTLVVGPTGETMLIDTGDFTDDGRHVLAYLQRHDIDQIEYLVVSHNDADHIGGNAAIIEYYETEADGIGAIYDPGIAASTDTYREYLDAVEAHDVTLYETREGDAIPFEGVDVTVMGPPDPYIENEARNENSIVLKLGVGQTSFLLSGDAEDDQEAYLVEAYGERLNATVLKAGHHGSKTSSSGPFLDAVAPQAIVISSAYDSRYGHPHVETLQRLAARSLPTYWTGTHGDIVLVSDGSRVTVKTQRSAPTDPRALRDGDPIQPGTTGAVEPRTTIGGDGHRTPIAADGGAVTTATPAAGEGLTVAAINADAAGDDRENLTGEYIVFANTGATTLDLSGWTVSDEADHVYTVPAGITVAPGATLTLRTGSGTDTDTELYWGAERPIWNNGGDTVIVTNSQGQEVLRETYS